MIRHKWRFRTEMVAALYVETNGAYYGLPDVDPWDIARDARTYDGPYPVVAHPPCSRWCQLASVNHARWGTPIGEDGGCFEAALAAVRTYGGVLEHPAYSLAWPEFNLPVPARGFWRQSLLDDAQGWVTEISQSAYGHVARKRTWLYMVGAEPVDLDWSEPPQEAHVGAGVNSGVWCSPLRRATKTEALATPLAFRDLLLDLARSSVGAHV